MDGLNNNFINKYKEFTSDKSEGGKNLSNAELQKLEKMLSSGAIDPAAAEALKAEIIKGGIDGSERQLLLAIGHSITDSKKLGQFKKALDSDPVNGQISNLIDRGFEERKREEGREATASPIETAFRVLSDKTGLSTASKVVSAMYNVDVSINTPAEEAEWQTRKLMEQNAPTFKNSVEDNDCIKDSLTAIANANPNIFVLGDVPTRAVSQSYLEQVTGRQWDGINVKESGDKGHLKDALKGQEGKALVVVGSHTFVFQGFDKAGNLKVTDPSDSNKPRTISKDNPAASAYAMTIFGGGDGGETQGLNKGGDTKNLQAMVKNYKNIEVSMNSADKDNSESLNIRKLLSLMGDPSQKETFAKIKAMILDPKNNRVPDLQKLLASQGIKLDADELANMVIKMREPIDAKSNTMLNDLENLQNANVNDKTRYQFGIQYSDVNLKDFFTRTSSGSMHEVFQDMIAGRDGC